MSSVIRKRVGLTAKFVAALALFGLIDSSTSQVFGAVAAIRQVGGVMIDANGVLSNREVGTTAELVNARAKALQPTAGDLDRPSEMRKVSLRRLEAALAEALETGKPVSDEMRFLAGLQQIRYVIALPEQNDIILAGFGEGWVVDKMGNLVGKTTGRPVMLLDDLLVALRSARDSAQGGISCSIDPTQAGLQRLQQLAESLKSIGDPDTTTRAIEQALGPQQISVHGVPGTSHMARVLVSADYRMKRIGMKLDKSPVAGLGSYLDMISGGGRGMQSMTPRWWMVPNYAPLLTDPEGLTFELRGGSVKTMTEETFFTDKGQAQGQKGKTSTAAQRWADQMTTKFDDLAKKEPIFGELRNCMDLAIVAALIIKENLPTKTGYQFSLLTDGARLPNDEYPLPKQVDTQASLVMKSGSAVISASGGVQIQPWQVIEKPEQTTSLSPVRSAAAEAKDAKVWWWN